LTSAGDKIAGLVHKDQFNFWKSYHFTSITLLRRNKPYTTMAMMVIIPSHKRGSSLVGLFYTIE